MSTTRRVAITSPHRNRRSRSASGACGTKSSVSASIRSIKFGTESVRSRRKPAPLRARGTALRPGDDDPAVEHQMLAHAVAPHMAQRLGFGEGLSRDRDHVRNQRDRIGMQVAADCPGAAAVLDGVQQRRVSAAATDECALQRYQPAEAIVEHRQ
jgi:hypothetical protein